MLDNQGRLSNLIPFALIHHPHHVEMFILKPSSELLLQVFCEEELIEAIENATGPKKDCLCFIEVIVHKDDTSKELLEWGSRVSAANSRPPNPQ